MTISFEEHPNTNYAPTDEQQHEILHMLPEPEEPLSGMKGDIDDLVQHIDQHRALTSPIRRIPQEILQEIFIHCLPTNRNAIMSAREAPLTLGRVCSSWRSISISTPRLWTTVHVPIPDGYLDFEWKLCSGDIAPADRVVAAKRIADLRTAALKEWLNRSRSLPVNISFTHRDHSLPPISVPALQSHHSHPIVDTILSVAHRWRKISIAAPAQTMVRFLTHSPHELPFLESLDFDFSLGRAFSEIPLQDQNIYRTPSLRKLYLMHPRGDCSQLPVSWAQLTDLTIERKWRTNFCLRLPQAAELLSRCPRLVRCRLEIPFAAKTPVEFPLIVLPDLESLTILEVTDVTSMFNCLDLPVLREVEYHTALTPSFARRPSLLTLLKKSNGLIRKFATSPQTFTKTELIECLRFIPSATTLIFKRSLAQVPEGLNATPILDKEFLYSFLPSASGGQTICPQLLNLHIGYRLPYLSNEDLLGFLLEKQGAGSSEILAPKLKRLRLAWKMEIVPDLARLVEEGLDLRLGYPPRPSKVLFSPLDGLRAPSDM